MKPDKDRINETERRLAESWRTIKQIQDNYNKMSEDEVREKLGELQVDMILDDQRLKDL